MFDELHDDTPPVADSHQFATVAERAAALKRKRRAAIGTLGAVVVLAGGGVAITATTNGTDDARLVTIDNAEPPPTTTTESDEPPATLSPTPTVAESTRDAEREPATGATTVPDSTTTSLVEPAQTSTVETSPVVGEPVPLQCAGFRVCTFDHLADGRLVQLGNDGGESGPPTFSIYDDSGTTIEATGLLGNFDAVGAFLVDVGPGDIAYVWYQDREEPEVARMGAFELTGQEAGRQITQFEARIDFSGDTEQVTTRDGFVNVGCCGPDAVRPAPEAEVVIPWVDRDGNEITNDEDAFFTSEFVDQTLSISATRGGVLQTWSFPEQEAGPRGMPTLHELDDGRVFFVFEPLHNSGSGPIPAYLNADGTVDFGGSPGIILHAVPDGRVVLRDMQAQTYSLATLSPPTPATIEASTEPSESAPSTTVTAPESSIMRPLVAVNTDGDAVYFDENDANPTVIFDGPEVTEPLVGDGPNSVDLVAYSAAEDRFVVSRCCSPIVGQIVSARADRLPMPADITPPGDQTGEADLRFDSYGYAPALDPSGAVQASIAGEGTTIVIIDAATDRFNTMELPSEVGALWDLNWTDSTTIAVLGRGDNVWILTIVRYEAGDLRLQSSRDFATIGAFDDLRFAGTALDDEIAVHALRTDMVLSGGIDDYGNNNGNERGSSLQVITLPGTATSAWYADPGQLIWVDTEGVLRVGERIIDGEYTWARR